MASHSLSLDINSYSERRLEQRKHWYSPVAEAYSQARPQYPCRLVDQVIELSQLSSASRILEVGCGPATATLRFARLGCSMICLEPNQGFYQLAQRKCGRQPNVEIKNLAFEEWEVGDDKFDAVLAASSLHWIPQDIAHLKSAQALRMAT